MVHCRLRLIETVPQSGTGLVGVHGALRLGLLFPHFRQLRKDLIRRGPGIPDDALGLCLAPATGVFLGPLHLLPELPGLAGVLLPLTVQPVHFNLPLFQGLALGLQLGQHVLKPDTLAVDLPLGLLDDLIRQTQPLGDGKGVGLAGNTNQQAERGGQGLHVKLTGGILHARRGHGEGFQLRVVGGGRHSAPQLPHPLDDGNGQGRALHRVRTGAQLIEQHQAVAVRLLQNAHYIGHMGRESGQILFNALLVADIGQHGREYGDGALGRHGDVEAALGHQRQQAQGLQADGFAAGVGAGDDQCVKGLAQLQINGHCLLGVQQRVPGFPQRQAAVPADLRAVAVHFIGELATGENQVQVHHGLIVPLDVLPVGRRLGGQLRQNAGNLLLLLGLQLNQLVVGLHHAHGLHEHGGTGGGDVVDQTRQIALVGRLHRHHEAAIPLGDDGLLQNLSVAGRGDDLLQNLPALGLGRPHMAADVRQLRAGRVGDGVLIHDAAVDLLLQKAIAVKGEKQGVDGRFLPGLLVEILLGPPGGPQKARNHQQFLGVQGTAPVCPVQGLRHRLHAGERRASPEADHLPGRVCLVQQSQNLLRLGLWPDVQGPLLGLRADGLLGEQFQHPWQLQCTHGFLK